LIHESATLENGATIGKGTRVWRNSHIRSNSIIGTDGVIGENVFIDCDVIIGDRVKIQNSAQVYAPAVIESGVFIGPGVILTNDKHPRSVNGDMSLKLAEDWTRTGVYLEEGASLGAGVICVAPVKVGKWALVGAGSVVVKDVPAQGLVVGNPATQIGWVNKSGTRLKAASNPNHFIDEESGQIYEVVEGALEMKLEL
jgi:acetyltransferase-like isoleucine patch superfamily enzyme